MSSHCSVKTLCHPALCYKAVIVTGSTVLQNKLTAGGEKGSQDCTETGQLSLSSEKLHVKWESEELYLMTKHKQEAHGQDGRPDTAGDLGWQTKPKLLEEPAVIPWSLQDTLKLLSSTPSTSLFLKCWHSPGTCCSVSECKISSKMLRQNAAQFCFLHLQELTCYCTTEWNISFAWLYCCQSKPFFFFVKKAPLNLNF